MTRTAGLVLASAAAVLAAWALAVATPFSLAPALVALIAAVAAAATAAVLGTTGAVLLAFSALTLAGTVLPSVPTAIAVPIALIAAPVAIVSAAASAGSRRRGGGILLVVAAVVGMLRVTVDDPLRQIDCTVCVANPLVLSPSRGATVALALVVAALILLSAARPIRALPFVVCAAAAAVPGRIGDLAPSFALLLAIGASAIVVARALRARERLRRLADAPTDVATAVRDSVNDPGLRIRFPVDDGDGWVDALGAPIADAESGRWHDVVLHGRTVARLAPNRADPNGIASVVTPLVAVALDGERLSAQLAARVAETRASRERVVRRADEERRTLERDLHDGAQQVVLALGFQLRAALAEHPDATRRDALVAAIADAERALDQLREIAHGAYPALLASSGLVSVLRQRGGAGHVIPRLSASIERLAWLVADELDPDARGSASAEVRFGQLALSITTDRNPGPILRERVAALDGRLDRTPAGWRLEVPCA